MSDKLINRAFVSLNNFDPLKLDLSEIKELSASIPKDGNIDVNQAETLATKFIRGSDICGEILALATGYMAKTKDAKEKAYNQAFLIKSAEMKNIKTDKMRVSFAELDEDYQNACEQYNQATAFLKWIDTKYNTFNKTHYLCKKILERAYSHEKAESWNGQVKIEENNDW